LRLFPRPLLFPLFLSFVFRMFLIRQLPSIHNPVAHRSSPLFLEIGKASMPENSGQFRGNNGNFSGALSLVCFVSYVVNVLVFAVSLLF
jgi:hypothetical protein